MPTLPRLNLIGPGKVGLALALAWHRAGAVHVAGVLASSADKAQAAVSWLGAGCAVAEAAQLPPAEFTLIATPDGKIADMAARLAAANVTPAGAVVWHASGALDSAVLAPLAAQGAQCASAHPVMTFADPLRAQDSLPGMPVALEGDAQACARIHALFARVGAQPFSLAAGSKAAYHAALAMASNYLVTLVELASQTLRQAGVATDACPALLAPLMRQSLDNALNMGPLAALTGPIARGDAHTVAAHLAALASAPERARSYAELGRATLALATPRLNAAQHQALSAALDARS